MAKKSPVLTIVLTLIIIGLFFVSLSSLSEASSTTGDRYFFIKKQFIWLLVGSISYLFFSKINLDFLKKISSLLYFISIFILVIVLIPGLGSQALGARRWLDLGFIGIQPSEFVKLTSIIYFSHIFSQKNKQNLKNLIIYLGIPFLLILLEPNLSTAVLVSAIVITLYYLAGGEIFSLFGICLSLIVISLLFTLTSPYRIERLKTLTNPQTASTTSSYHHKQIVLALASGGLFGKGFANSDQKYKYLPKISTDSILAVIGEETGFLGLIIIFFLYLSLISYLFKISSTIADPFKSLLISGTAAWIAIQTIINVAAISAIIPLTGVPLPFISYGGSSLLTLMSAVGIIKNIEKHPS
ncbi:MAG: putative peptidoglycan glycosyltransferase FtsW [Candidatus Shapirobacteria bacterium]